MTLNNTITETMLCSNCNGINIIKDNTRGEHICTDCGTVHEERLIDQGPEYRIFNKEEGKRRSRTGGPTTLVRHDKGLQTTISLDDKDIYGNKMSPHRKAQISFFHFTNKTKSKFSFDK